MPLYSLDGFVPDLPTEGDYWLAPDAQLIGKVKIGRNASIWYGSVLRGDNEQIEVGEETNIQEHGCLHTDMGAPLRVGRGCTIGHRVVLHGCTIGDNTLIGIGSTIMNHAVIGENCLIGSHTLITERKTIPPGSLVMGSPGKVVRALTAEEIKMLEWTAVHYVENWKRFAKGAMKYDR